MQTTPSVQGSTILIVDDTPVNLQAMAEILTEQGMLVAVAQDGDEGLARAELISPDLVLLDVKMPGLDGFDVCRRLKAINKTRDIPVIFMTALNETEDKVMGFRVGAVDYITRPFQTQEVMARITAHLTLRKMQEEIAATERRAAEAERLQLLQRLVEAQEAERLRLARELHDQMGQELTGVAFGLKSLDLWLTSGKGHDTLRWLQSVVAQINLNLHRTAWALRPTLVEDVGLFRALESCVTEWSERFGIEVDYRGCGQPMRFRPDVEMVAYRIVQEALTNVLKHAEANTVSLALECKKEELHITVKDDGKGFDPVAIASKGGLGLAGMRERLSLVGGTLVVESTPAVGTALIVRIPECAPTIA
jgi:signal transduction histidine kinase